MRGGLLSGICVLDRREVSRASPRRLLRICGCCSRHHIRTTEDRQACPLQVPCSLSTRCYPNTRAWPKTSTPCARLDLPRPYPLTAYPPTDGQAFAEARWVTAVHPRATPPARAQDGPRAHAVSRCGRLRGLWATSADARVGSERVGDPCTTAGAGRRETRGEAVRNARVVPDATGTARRASRVGRRGSHVVVLQISSTTKLFEEQTWASAVSRRSWSATVEGDGDGRDVGPNRRPA